MKKFIYTVLITLSMAIAFTGCGNSGGSVEITNTDVLANMNQITLSGIETYFDLTVPDSGYQFQGFQSHAPDTEGLSQHVNSVFQGSVAVEDENNTLVAYGSILSPDHTEIYGLILNVFPGTSEVLPLSMEEFEQIGSDFLTDKKLVSQSETIVSTGQNTSASNEYINVLNYESTTKYFAVGISLHTGEVTYFECVPKIPQ